MTILMIRKHKRFAVRRKASLVAPGKRARQALLVELCLDGCRLGTTCSNEFRMGEVLRMRIGGFADFLAEVRWAGQGFVGLRFIQALHIAELDELIRACRPEEVVVEPAGMRAYA